MDTREPMVSVSKAVLYGAIVIALVITGSFVYQKRFIENNMPALVKKAIDDLTPSPTKTRAVTADDHILGQIDAPVKLVVYTDLECPYCKTFHNTISSLTNTYIKDGKLAVIYRNMPLDQLHAKARPEAIAAECAAKLGGNEKYWAFVGKVFAATPSNDGLDLNLLPQFASSVGLESKAFSACQNDKAIAEKVEAEVVEAQQAGGQGTPYPIVLLDEEVQGALAGAVPASEITRIVDQLLADES